MEENPKVVSVKISEQDRDMLKHLAISDKVSMAQMVSKVVSRYVGETLPEGWILPKPKRKDSDIMEVFDTFKESGLWPIPNYGNRTERKAAQQLADAFGIEKVKAMVGKYAQELKSNRFLPQGHRPSLMVANLGAIAAKMGSVRKNIDLDEI